MTKPEVLFLIDDYKNRLIDPIEMLSWTWLRVIINQIPDDEWNKYISKAAEVMRQ